MTQSNIEAFDTSTGALTGVMGGSGPTSNAIVASPDGKHIYAVDNGGVSVIDTATDLNGVTLNPGLGNGAAEAVAVSPDGGTIYATTTANDLVSWNAVTGVRSSTVAQLSAVQGATVYGLAVTSGAAFVGATIPGMSQNPDEKVLMVPIGSSTVTHSQYIGSNTANRRLVAVASSDGTHVFVTDGTGTVAVIDSTGTQTSGLITGNAVGFATFGPYLYAAGADTEKINLAANTEISGTASGAAVAVTPDGAALFVPSFSDELQKVDAATLTTTTANFAMLDGTPVGAATGGPKGAADGVSISPGNFVAEPESGSVPESFTISLASPSATPVTVHYKTVDGTAKAAANAYTPITDASVTIPAGQTSAPPIQVQVNDGSNAANTPTEGFQVQLTSSSGPAISATAGSATGVILIPGISGTVFDTSGNPVPGQIVKLDGASAAGPAATRSAVADARGRYQLYADPGTYTLTVPVPTNLGTLKYVPIACPGTAQAGACAHFALNPGANLTVDFKQFDVVVNSTALDRDPQSSLDLGVCDTTPAATKQTCTLPAAIQLINGSKASAIAFNIATGAGNTFDGAVPQIKLPAGSSLDGIDTRFTIDGSTQPNAGQVEITGTGDSGLNLTAGSSGSVIQGLVLNRFTVPIFVGDAGSVVIQGNVIGTDPTGHVAMPGQANGASAGIVLNNSPNDQIGGPAPGNANLISGNARVGIQGVDADGVVIQGNTIGPARDGQFPLLPSAPNDHNVQQDAIQLFDQAGDPPSAPGTVGGAAPGDANVIAGGVSLEVAGSVFQGNTVVDGVVKSQGDHSTIGGAAGTPGGAPGNDFHLGGSLTISGQGTVVQGNHFRGTPGFPLITLANAKHVTIGGDKRDLGNRIEDATSGAGTLDPFQTAGIRVGQGPNQGSSSDNVIENNALVNNAGGGAVEVLSGVGNEIFANRMSGNNLGIDLGGIPFRFNTVGASHATLGPNHHQPYPELLSAVAHGSTDVTVGLTAPRGRYTVDLYSQRSCARDETTPGQGEEPLGREAITVGAGQATARLSFKHASGAVTATATAPDGSTSQFSPCLTLGHRVLTFIDSGVTVPYSTVEAQSGISSSARDHLTAQGASGKKKASARIATFQPFCPPITTRFCAGTIVLRRAHHETISRLSFKLAPGQLGAISFRLSAALTKLLERVHMVTLTAVINAHDGSRRAHHKSTKARLRIRLAARR